VGRKHEEPEEGVVKRYRVCPHCGNTDLKYIQDNGEAATSPDLALLCVARVKPSEWSFSHVAPLPEDYDAKGLVACGMQWDPNTWKGKS
jgi:hypothetical protein